jgi:serine/threonine protein kinase/WD40 repeat protein
MTLQPGQTLLHYRIVDKLGEGGMGVVWRATDTTLDRDVALKLLPESVATDAERLARFEREAKLLASLNHPNIAAVYGLHEDPSTRSGRFIAMELIEGEDLAAREPLTLEETLDVARQIAEAVEAAHEAGVVHRDLKPANVQLTTDGKVKVLDFGLAKALTPEAETSSGSVSMSPTVTSVGSVAGVILGTAAYMSPEQAKGKAVDKRADIWAFGVMLYEMLAGRRLFTGDSVPEVLGAIFREEIDLDALPAATPRAVRALVGRCLERDPRQRLRDIGEARIALQQDARDDAGEEEAATPVRSSTLARLGWAVATLFLVASIVLTLQLGGVDESPEILRFTVSQASGATFARGAGYSAIAPDGRTIIFVGSDAEGRKGLWAQPLDEVEARFLPGTEGASYPFWSPDSGRVAFFADGKLKRVALDGGRVEVLCDAPDGRGGAWSSAGVIAFSPVVSESLWRVDAEGGSPSRLTQLDPGKDELSHRFPHFLPDGRRYTFISETRASGGEGGTVYIGRLDSDERTPLFDSNRAPIYAEPGYLIYGRDGRLVAHRFDPSAERPEGDPIRLAELVPPPVNTSDRVASVSDTGLLLVASAPEQRTLLAWLDRQGRRVDELPLPPGNYSTVRISPDGKRVALQLEQDETVSDIWVADVERGTSARVTFSPARDRFAIWSPDGGRLAFHSNRNGPFDLFAKPIDGSGETVTLFASPAGWKNPRSWSHGYVAFETVEQETGYDIWIVPDDDPGAGRPYLATPSNESGPDISPDGRWLAYESNASGRLEVYVQSFPEPGTKYQVTTQGGGQPFWSADGSELFCITADGAVSVVPVTSRDGLTFGAVQPMFQMPPSTWASGTTLGAVDVTADGQRFAAILPENPAAQTLIVVMNWTAQLER